MYVQLIEVPYDSGHWGTRLGRGPGALLAGGMAERLRAAGHAVEAETLTWSTPFPTEVATGFALNHRLADRVRAARWHRRLPVVLAGNCLSSLGVLAGLREREAGIVWFDAHADYHTPETSTSGFLDGMALAVATGRCWRAAAAAVPGFGPVPPERALLVGARDLDAAEPAALAEAGVRWVPPAEMDGLGEALDALRARTDRVYVHLDLDVLDPAEGRANAYAAPDGPGLDAVRAAIDALRARFRVLALTLSAYDPVHDPAGRVRECGIQLATALLAGASRD